MLKGSATCCSSIVTSATNAAARALHPGMQTPEMWLEDYGPRIPHAFPTAAAILDTAVGHMIHTPRRHIANDHAAHLQTIGRLQHVVQVARKEPRLQPIHTVVHLIERVRKITEKSSTRPPARMLHAHRWADLSVPIRVAWPPESRPGALYRKAVFRPPVRRLESTPPRTRPPIPQSLARCISLNVSESGSPKTFKRS